MRKLPVTAEVERQRLFPLLVRRFEREAPAAAGVVDEDVDAAEAREGRLGHPSRGILGEHVLLDDDQAAGLVLQLFQELAATGDDGELYAFGGERDGDGAADADARAGDQRALAGDAEIHFSA